MLRACGALGFQHKERAESEVRLDEALRKLEAALAAASRKRDVEWLYDDTRHLDEFDKQAWPRAIEAIAAAPDDVRAIGLALRFLFGAGWVQRREEVDALLQRLYGERAASSRSDRDVWRRGYEQLLFMTGKSAEAAKVRAEIDASSSAPASWQPVFAAILDRKAFDVTLEHRVYAHLLASETLLHLRDKASPAVRALVKENAASKYPGVASRAGLVLVEFDPAAAQAAFERVLAMADAPLPNRLDSIMGLKQLAQRRDDHREVIRLSRCYVDTEGVETKFAPAMWAALAAMPKAVLEDPRGEEAERIEKRLADVHRAALALHDLGYAQKNLEALTAYDVGSGNAFHARSLLASLAVVAWKEGEEQLALDVAGYLLPQPLDERNRRQLIDGIAGVERHAKPAAAPWTTRRAAKEQYDERCR